MGKGINVGVWSKTSFIFTVTFSHYYDGNFTLHPNNYTSTPTNHKKNTNFAHFTLFEIITIHPHHVFSELKIQHKN